MQMIQGRERFVTKVCDKCLETKPTVRFAPTKSLFYPDGMSPICFDCLEQMIRNKGYDWAIVDKICQFLDIPFIPKEWQKINEKNRVNPFTVYTQLFSEDSYENLDWETYYKEFKTLEEAKMIEEELPGFYEQKIKELQKKWGPNYDEDELRYLENLYKGVLNTQSVNGDLQIDQAKKLCKISLEIEGRIRAGQDFDKLLKSYESLVKIAEFTPKNAKNANDFDSVGELFRWLEKRGWKNQYYDGVKRDVVDETIHNIQAYNQRLYTNESGIGDEITDRIKALQSAAALEESQSDFGTDAVCDDIDAYENAGYESLMKEEFNADLGETI